MPAKLAALITYLKAHPLYAAGGVAGLIALSVVIYYATRKSSAVPVAAALPPAGMGAPPARPSPAVTLLPIGGPNVTALLNAAKGWPVGSAPYNRLMAAAAAHGATQAGATWLYHTSGGCWAQRPAA